MFENFDIEVCGIFKEAENQKRLLHHEFVGTEHLLLAVLKRENSFTKKLNNFNLNYDAFYNEVNLSLSSIKKNKDSNIYTPLLKRVICKAKESYPKITEKHLLYHLLDEGEGVAIRLLIGMNVDVDALYNYLKLEISEPKDLEIYKIGKVLNDYIEINDKVVGRDKEIDLLIETLLRKKKNNPLLIGEAGVGKSAIVEEFTRRIINNEVPECLSGARVVMLEMGSLISGTRYRGEFEERLTNLIKELVDNSNIILFIDEIHSMVNAGAADGAISASDILKPYLARGDIKCIGATTKNEYEKFILKDKALTRRFEVIMVNEPSEEETINILKSVKDEYIKFHKVKIKDDVIEVLVHLANTYFPGKRNPDKSLELLDSVMSYVKLKEGNNLIKEKELELKKITMARVKEIEKGNYKEALKNNIMEDKLKKEINNIKNGSKLCITKDDIIDVLEYKNNLIITDNKIKKVNQNLKNKYDQKTVNSIAKMLNHKYGVKTLMITGDYGNFIEDLSKTLGYDVIKIFDENSIDKLFNKIKYYPSMIIEVDNDKNFLVNNLLKKITKEKIVEYKNEFVSFNNAIIIIKAKEKSLGFNNHYVSDIPLDEIISFNKIKIAK